MNVKNSKEYLKSVKEDSSFRILKLAIGELKEKYNVSENELMQLAKQPASKEILIPIAVYEAKNLSALEIVCKYLKEDLGIGYSKIATLLNRDNRTIWTTYQNAASKRKERLSVKDS